MLETAEISEATPSLEINSFAYRFNRTMAIVREMSTGKRITLKSGLVIAMDESMKIGPVLRLPDGEEHVAGLSTMDLSELDRLLTLEGVGSPPMSLEEELIGLTEDQRRSLNESLNKLLSVQRDFISAMHEYEAAPNRGRFRQLFADQISAYTKALMEYIPLAGASPQLIAEAFATVLVLNRRFGDSVRWTDGLEAKLIPTHIIAGRYRARVWLDDVEVTDFCYEADSKEGWVGLFRMDGHKILLGEDKQPARETKYGKVRIELPWLKYKK